jgi:hypothetical protein
VREDTGSFVNWISPAEVNRLAVPVRGILQPKIYFGLEGQEYHATQEVTLTLTGHTSKSSHAVFLVAPEGFPVNGVVVGTDFIQQWGHAHVLFPETKEREMMIMVQNRVTVGIAMDCEAWPEMLC